MKSDLEYLDSLQGSGIRPGLARMRALLRAAGNPHRCVPCAIVAGTNGKGSTAATLASILHAAGYRTGLYTSPHLVDLSERWTIDGVPAGADSLSRAIVALRAAAREASIQPTYFEALTMLAFLIFPAEGCDVVVLEVGMGGRLDATNVVRPVAALVTPVDFDHMEFLGRTLRAIAREKAGVIHRGSIALTSNTDPTVLRVVEARARGRGARLHRVLDEIAVRAPRAGKEGIHFRLETPRGSYRIASPLAGEHQIANVALAVRAAEEMARRFPRIDRRAIERGVAATRWRGRLERFVAGGKEVFVDGAHNAHATARVAAFVRRHLPRPRLLVFGVMKDKPARAMIETLFPLFDRVIATEPPEAARALSAREVKRLGVEIGARVEVRKTSRAAIRAALASDARSVLVCGSLYLAGEAIATLDRATAPRRRAPRARRATRRR